MTLIDATIPKLAASNRTMLRNLAAGVLLGALVLAGCSAAAPAAIEAPLGAPNLVEMRYACDGPPGFLPSLLDQPANAETENHPSAAALRATIAEAGPDIDMLPDSGYWLVSRDERVAHYLARVPAVGGPGLVSAIIENQGGGWKRTGWGECRPWIVRDGLSPATWTLDPNAPAPGADATTFAALVTEVACTSATAMGARLQPPSITYSEEEVLLVFAALPLVGDGFATCPSNPATRVIIKLSEPLGDRRLLDAAVFPPAEPVAPEF